jgi:hypothetical protein
MFCSAIRMLAPERHLGIEPQAVAAGRDPPLRANRGRLDENQAGAAERKTPEMHEMKIVGEAIVRAVHRHRRDDNAVAQGHTAKEDRLEQQRRLSNGFGIFNRLNRHRSP